VRWDAFEHACPEIATLARQRFVDDELVMIGTIRRDGSPRISPNETDFAVGRLFVSMMWHSRKAADLLRDPRIVVHSVTANRQGTDGDVKLDGRVVDERHQEVREASAMRSGTGSTGPRTSRTTTASRWTCRRPGTSGSATMPWPSRGILEAGCGASPLPGRRVHPTLRSGA
jgi:Pyridoxamine 5'-phosphate oxidase